MRYEDRRAATGAHCPTSGDWTTPAWPALTIFIPKGDVMPPLDGVAVEWHYSSHATKPAVIQGSPSRQRVGAE